MGNEKEVRTMMMMMKNSNQISRNEPFSASNGCPSWKLYENPIYDPHPQHHHHQPQRHDNNLHRLRLPLSARKIAASIRDLTFFRPAMDSELDSARARIVELKAELRQERRARKEVESINKTLAKEVAEERKRREEEERICGELAGEIAAGKAEIDRRRREIEEERKMMRVAEVLREERVQMKLADAKFLLEEKITELEVSRRTKTDSSSLSPSSSEQSSRGDDPPALPLKPSCNGNIWPAIHRRGSPEAENPHIKRGIKGFVEFPRVVRAIGSKSRNWGSKVECQKAQLRIMMKQKSSIGYSNNLIIS